MGVGGERENIGKMAEKISEEIFSFFRWEKEEAINLNFPCCNMEKHFKTEEGLDSSNKCNRLSCIDFQRC